MAVTGKNDICNMALGHMGNYGTINNIDDPSSTKETTFALWYDDALEATLRLSIPNFARSRRIVSKRATAPAFGYTYAYEYPADCVKVLGFGDIDAKDRSYTVEGEDILMDEDYPDGLQLRFISNATDVSKMTSTFKILFSWVLASYTAMSITQKRPIMQDIEKKLPMKILELSGADAQENPPIRKSVSKFKQARYSNPVRNNAKK